MPLRNCQNRHLPPMKSAAKLLSPCCLNAQCLGEFPSKLRPSTLCLGKMCLAKLCLSTICLSIACLFSLAAESTAQTTIQLTDSTTTKTVQPTEFRVRAPKPKAGYELLLEKARLLEESANLVQTIFEVCEPTVVHIDAQKDVRKNGSSPVRIEEAGAGVIFAHGQSQYVLTNRHLVADARLEDIRIQLADGSFFRPTEVRSDRETDLAVIYIRQANLVSARLGDSEEVRVGQYVVAVGSPFGLNHSVSQGIVSALGRRDLDLGDSGVRLQNFIQTDAAINPGNSGGPLLNLRGEVIGINTAIASNSGHNEGIGFTIPINMAMQVARDLIDYGSVRRGYMGVSLDSRFTPEKAESMGLNTVFGTRVTAITPDSPASRVDVQLGDVILKYGNIVIENDSHLVNEVSLTRGGSQIPLTIYRRGRTLQVTVQIEYRE